jgi:hypothetical protein
LQVRMLHAILCVRPKPCPPATLVAVGYILMG